MVYTGDFKYEQSRLLEAAANRFPRIETLVMESTYGGHEDVQPSRNRAEKELVKTIYSTLKRGVRYSYRSSLLEGPRNS